MPQLILHLIGDYVTQSDWMATRKIRSSGVAAFHAALYSLPFLLLGSAMAVLVIFASHFFVDRFRLAKYLVFAKNYAIHPGGSRPRWKDCEDTGYPSTTPIWLATWLLIIADNTIHLAFNYVSLRYL